MKEWVLARRERNDLLRVHRLSKREKVYFIKNNESQDREPPPPPLGRLQEVQQMSNGRIDIELNSQSLEALDIPNPGKKKTLKVPCSTHQSVSEVLDELYTKILYTLNSADRADLHAEIHDHFYVAHRQLDLQEGEKHHR